MNNGNWYPNPYGYGQERTGEFRGNSAGQGFGQFGQSPYWAGQNTGQPMQQMPQNQPMSLYDVIGQGTRVDWVQGEAAMKSYMVRPGMSVILFDMDNPNRVYVKAVNMAGVPIFTAGFDLGEVKLGQPAGTLNDERYVSREEYEKSMSHIAQLFAGLTEKKEAVYERQNESTGMGHEQSAAHTTEPAGSEPGTGFPGV